MSQPPFDMSQILAQAKQMGERLERVKEQLRHRTVEASVGGGMVDVKMNGALEVVSVRIDPQAVDPRDVEMLQDLVVAAMNQALQRAQEMAATEMQSVTGLPPGALGSLLGGSG